MDDRKIKAEEKTAVSPEDAARLLAELRTRLDDALRQVEEYKASYLRARADYDNLRKRAERDVEEKVRLGKASFMLSMLEIADDLERALAAGSGHESLKDGLCLTVRKLEGLLKMEGLEPICAEGKAFDPALHEAVSASEGDVDVETVCGELRKGYTYCGSTLRPSAVKVAVPRKDRGGKE